MFTNLCAHSYYSLLMSSLSIDDIISFALKNKMKYVAICDFNNMYGAIEFYIKATNNNLIPIIGLHINYLDEPLVLIAKNLEGYKNLMKISSLIMINETDPIISKVDKTQNYKNIEKQITNYFDNLFVICNQASKTNLQVDQNDIYSFDQKDVNPIAAKMVFYENEADVEIVKTLYAINNRILLEDLVEDKRFNGYELLDEIKAKKQFSEQSLKNLDHLLEHVKLEIKFNQKRSIFNYEKISKKNSEQLLADWCKQGLEAKGIIKQGKIPFKYATRLQYELDVINKMNFANYFLIVADYVSYAKSQGILVGPGRGSAAGSLISYLLNITTVDPIVNNLLFERFLNPQRATMPDIDIDFMDSRRNEIIEYLFNKYGSNHVAHIITFQRLKAKMAIRDVGKVLNIELPIINQLANLIISEEKISSNQSPQLKKAFDEYPKLFKIATKIIDFPRQYGLHAAGVVLVDEELSDLVPLQNSTDGIFSTQFSMEYLEPLGLIKMDILGLVNLTSLDLIIKKIQKNHGIKINLEKINFEDSKVFKYIADGNTTGIFQLESNGMTNLVRKVNPKSIEDISICSALYRPGPQQNINIYLENRRNPKNIKYLNDDVKQILESTSNIIIYQEQIIQLVQKIAGFSLAEADLFRRAISKKKVDKLASLQKSFVSGAIKQGYSKEISEKIFDTIFQFANYGFNHSHSLAYSYISYWLAYLAYYYPIEFFTVILSSYNPNSKDINNYLSQIKKNGIKISPPDINYSNITFDNHNDTIIFGFDSIKGVGFNYSSKILEIRQQLKDHQFTNIMETIRLLSNNGSNGLSMIRSLAYGGCFDELLKKENKTRFWLINNLETLFNGCTNIGSDGKAIIPLNFNNAEPTDEDIRNLEKKQMELIGVSFLQDPIIDIKKRYCGEWKINQLLEINFTNDSSFYHTMVYIDNIREIKTKSNTQMCFLSIHDETMNLSAVCFPSVYIKSKPFLVKNTYVLLTVKVDINKKGSIIVLNIRSIDDCLVK